MKNLNLFILFVLATVTSSAQSDIKNPIEMVAERKGAIIEKRYDEVGKIGSLNIQIEYITDLTSNDKLKCVRFDVQPPNSTNISSALLDTNEVNELISFVKYITTTVTNRPPVDPNTEISYTNKYNVQIGCFWQGGDNGWALFFRTDSQDAATEADINQANIDAFMKTLHLAKSQIQAE